MHKPLFVLMNNLLTLVKLSDGKIIIYVIETHQENDSDHYEQ